MFCCFSGQECPPGSNPFSRSSAVSFAAFTNSRRMPSKSLMSPMKFTTCACLQQHCMCGKNFDEAALLVLRTMRWCRMGLLLVVELSAH